MMKKRRKRKGRRKKKFVKARDEIQSRGDRLHLACLQDNSKYHYTRFIKESQEHYYGVSHMQSVPIKSFSNYYSLI